MAMAAAERQDIDDIRYACHSTEIRSQELLRASQ